MIDLDNLRWNPKKVLLFLTMLLFQRVIERPSVAWCLCVPIKHYDVFGAIRFYQCLPDEK